MSLISSISYSINAVILFTRDFDVDQIVNMTLYSLSGSYHQLWIESIIFLRQSIDNYISDQLICLMIYFIFFIWHILNITWLKNM